MSSLVISGDTSGSVTLQAPAVAGTTVLTLPATSGTVITSASGTAATATNLAGGSNGTIPYQSASGTTQMLAVGTSGQVLQTNGAGAPSWVTPSAGAVTLISTQTASSSSSISWTGLTGYNNYLLIVSGVDFAGSDYLALEFGTGGTPTYVTTGYYISMTAVDIGSTTTVNRYGISNYSSAFLNNPNQAIIKINSVCYIFGMTNSNNTALSFQSNGVSIYSGLFGSYVGQTTLLETTVKTAIRVSGGNSNTFSGALSLYGISS